MFRKAVLLLTLVPAVLLAAAGDLAVVSIEEMTDELYADFREGILGDLVVRVDAGSELPTYFMMVGDTLAVEQSSPMTLHVLKTLYLRTHNEELQFSLDCEKWGGLPEIFRSNLGMMINVDQDTPTGAFALFLTCR